MMTRKPLLFVALITLAACGPAPAIRPHDDSVAGHRRDAASHQAEADATVAYANSRSYYQNVHRNHQRLAAAHLRAAEQLEAEYATACKGRAPDAVSAWPVVQSTDEVPGGVVLHLPRDVGSEATVLAQLECHRATLALDGFDRFPDDPLAIDELDIVVHAESSGTAIMFGVDGEAQVQELRRRVGVIAPARGARPR